MVTEFRPISQLPWQVNPAEFERSAAGLGEGGACCAFVIDGSIPQSARSGYAALVIAYARADEPVCILDDGTAILLIREGGKVSGEVVAKRILAQMRRLSLDQTLRAGVAPLGSDPSEAIEAARRAAQSGEPGSATVSS